MKRFVSYKSSAAAAAAMVLLLGSASVAAKAPSDVADLVGARGAGGETELGNRGYTYVTMTKGVQYWWNARHYVSNAHGYLFNDLGALFPVTDGPGSRVSPRYLTDPGGHPARIALNCRRICVTH